MERSIKSICLVTFPTLATSDFYAKTIDLVMLNKHQFKGIMHNIHSPCLQMKITCRLKAQTPRLENGIDAALSLLESLYRADDKTDSRCSRLFVAGLLCATWLPANCRHRAYARWSYRSSMVVMSSPAAYARAPGQTYLHVGVL